MTGDRPAASGFTPAPTGFVVRSQTRPSTPTESSSLRRPIRGRLCYGLVVLVALLSTPDCSDAVTVRYRTVHHRTEADFHRPIPSPSQAHERDRPGRPAARLAQQLPPAERLARALLIANGARLWATPQPKQPVHAGRTIQARDRPATCDAQ